METAAGCWAAGRPGHCVALACTVDGDSSWLLSSWALPRQGRFRARLGADETALRAFWRAFLSRPIKADLRANRLVIGGMGIDRPEATTPFALPAGGNGDRPLWPRLVEDFAALGSGAVGGAEVARDPGGDLWKIALVFVKCDKGARAERLGLARFGSRGELRAVLVALDELRAALCGAPMFPPDGAAALARRLRLDFGAACRRQREPPRRPGICAFTVALKVWALAPLPRAGCPCLAAPRRSGPLRPADPPAPWLELALGLQTNTEAEQSEQRVYTQPRSGKSAQVERYPLRAARCPAMAAQRTARAVLLAAGLLAAPAAGATPMEKVITLIEEMKTEVETEGATEAKAYDKFACFCRDTTASKADAVTGGRATIDDLSTSIAEDTAQLRVSTTDLTDRKVLQESLTKQGAAKKLECEKEEVDYKSEAAKMSKAITSIQNAVNALESSKPAPSALLELRQAARESPGLAAAVSLMEQRATSLRRVDPLSPEYKFFSQPIIDTLTKLLGEFGGKKTELDDEWSKTKSICDTTLLDFGTQMDNNGNSMLDLTAAVETLKGTIAAAREQLVLAEATLKDDKLYLKDLTEQCERRASDWDQRSATRGEELAALAQVLEILTGHTSALDAEVNKRALLVQRANRTGQAATGQVAAMRGIREVPSLLQRASHGAPSGASLAAVAAHDHEGAAAQGQKLRMSADRQSTIQNGHEGYPT
ncbi:unnamed protein product [Prorocentrum cordatum]|uniref:Uncharacterized protein n=1 Tax=Prorocentrum cordatum TaxID=2364126 RepID=A0ABN9TJE2_9DINO|nr:unnamed protein product [Polarella glacialis]